MPTLTAHTALSGPAYLTQLRTAAGHTLQADEPVAAGGQDQAPSPGELLAAALSACTCITVRLYAARKAWPLEAVETVVTFENTADHVVRSLQRTLVLRGELAPEQRQRLLAVAERCPIHQSLAGSIAITTMLAE